MVSVAEPSSNPPDAGFRRRSHGPPEARISRTVLGASQITRAGFVVWVPFWLSVGIALWFSLRQEPGPVFYTLVAAIFLVASVAALLPFFGAGLVADGRRGDRIVYIAFVLSLVSGGALVAGLRSDLVAAPVLEFRYYGPIEGRVVGIDRSARDRVRITLDRVTLRNFAPERTPGRVRISMMGNDTVPDPGEHVMLTGHLGPPPGPSEPGGFDFRRNAWFEGLGAVGYSRTPVMRAGEPQEGGVMALHRLRMQLSRAIQDRIGGQAGAVAAALMTGDRSAISEATNEVMRVSSLYHIISISGLHMTMLAAFVYGTLRFLGILVIASGSVTLGTRSSPPLHKFAALGALLASAGYLWLSGGGVATERAFIMVAVMLIAILADRRAISLRTVAIAALLVLLSAPEALLSPSFQMSFAATVALVLMSGPWQMISPSLPRWSHAALLLCLTSLFAGLATGPIAAMHFGRIALYGLMANLLVVPVMGAFVMNMGVIALLLAPFGLEGAALWIMGLGTKWMLLVAEWITALDGSDLLLRLPPPEVVPLVCTGMTVAALAARRIVVIRGRKLPAPVFATGLAMVSAGFAIWATDRRPEMLISASGDAVGIMTTQGRAMSKESGGAFSVDNWLADDGDAVTQERSAARPGWTGQRNLRTADFAVGRDRFTVIHATGKGAAEAGAAACAPGAIVVSSAALARKTPGKPACLILDAKTLMHEGAVAMRIDGQDLRIISVAQQSGRRNWSQKESKIIRSLTDFPGKE